MRILIAAVLSAASALALAGDAVPYGQPFEAGTSVPVAQAIAA